MTDRRTFILVCGPFVAAASALAIFPSLLPGELSSQLVAGKTDMNGLVFKIVGWDLCDDVAGDCSKTISSGHMTSDLIGDPVFISVNQSWRSAWR